MCIPREKRRGAAAALIFFNRIVSADVGNDNVHGGGAPMFDRRLGLASRRFPAYHEVLATDCRGRFPQKTIRRLRRSVFQCPVTFLSAKMEVVCKNCN